MAATVKVNQLTVVHRSSEGQVVSGPPSPGGPVPVPYVNVAFSRHLAKGTKTVRCDGNPIAVADSEFATSTGDEAGTASGGVVSGHPRRRG